MKNDELEEVDNSPVEDPILETPPDQPAISPPITAPKTSSAWAQSVGCQREHNEDSLFALSSALSSQETVLPFGLYVVADGMGGHLYGEKASSIAVRAFSSYLINTLLTTLLSPEERTPDPIQELSNAAIQEAQQQVVRQTPGGGTTLTAVLMLGEQMTISHVGDSRAYHFPAEGNPRILTQDHSLVNKLIELGHLDIEQAAVHPQRNVLYRALGQADPVAADIYTMHVPTEGILLVCSDGLWGTISDSIMADIIRSTPDLQDACQELVNAANRAGGPDNISAILVRLPVSA